MFADEIINSKHLRDVELGWAGHDYLRDRLRAAQKFVLTPDFVSVSDAIYADKSQLHKTLQFCRLPFRLCWFEFAAQRRQRWLSGATECLSPVAVPQSEIDRIGYLFQMVEGEETWVISMFWKIRGHPEGVVSFTPYSVSLKKEERSPEFLTRPGNKVANSIMEWAKGFAERVAYGNYTHDSLDTIEGVKYITVISKGETQMTVEQKKQKILAAIASRGWFTAECYWNEARALEAEGLIRLGDRFFTGGNRKPVWVAA